MMWTDTPCRTTCWDAVTRRWRRCEARRSSASSPSIPGWRTTVCTPISSCPANTTFEVDDHGTQTRPGDSFLSVVLQRQAIAPIGESKSDYEIVCEMAKKFDMYEKVTEGFTRKRYQRGVRRHELGKIISWEEFHEKEYLIVPVRDRLGEHPAGLYDFYKDPEANPLPTPTGKLEFYSESLAKHFPNDRGTAAIPKWVEKGSPMTRGSPATSQDLSAPRDVQPRPLENACSVRRHHLDQGSGHLKEQGLGRLLVRAPLDEPTDAESPRHQERRHRQGLQRARRRALRGAGVGKDHAGGRLCRPRRQGRLHNPSELDRGGAINCMRRRG